ncbi:MAG: hypothetical protein N2483_01705, partial [Burkholderiaceae bacterium]|nr:hypothetical protein [Burkholderiaceae bacterium]
MCIRDRLRAGAQAPSQLHDRTGPTVASAVSAQLGRADANAQLPRFGAASHRHRSARDPCPYRAAAAPPLTWAVGATNSAPPGEVATQ